MVSRPGFDLQPQQRLWLDVPSSVWMQEDLAGRRCGKKSKCVVDTELQNLLSSQGESVPADSPSPTYRPTSGLFPGTGFLPLFSLPLLVLAMRAQGNPWSPCFSGGLAIFRNVIAGTEEASQHGWQEVGVRCGRWRYQQSTPGISYAGIPRPQSSPRLWLLSSQTISKTGPWRSMCLGSFT